MAIPARSMAEGRDIPAHPDDVREGLREARERRIDAERARADAMADTYAWVVAGVEAGLDKTELATLAGLSRQTIYDLLGDMPRPERGEAQGG